MTEAMQMTVSSAIAKRIDESSSTARRSGCGALWMRTPWVISDMRGSMQRQVKTGGPTVEMDPPALGLVACQWFPARGWEPI